MGALFTGTLTDHLRQQVATMRLNQRRTEMLYDFTKRIAAKSDLDDVLYASACRIAATLNCNALILMPGAIQASSSRCRGYPSIEEELDPRRGSHALGL